MQHLVRDGVRLAYVESRPSSTPAGPPILLVHGMMCNHTHMLGLFRHLAPRHRVVAVDLRGHGESDKPQADYSDIVFNDDLEFLCRALELERPIGIGHSFGGSTQLHLAATRPHVLGGLVLLDSGVRSAAAKQAELGPVYDDQDLAGQRAFLGARLFGPSDDPAERERILDGMMAVPRHVQTSMQKAVLAFDGTEAALRVRIPSAFLLAEKPFTEPATLARLGPNWRVGQVLGSGHFIQLFAAAQVHAMVDRFLELV